MADTSNPNRDSSVMLGVFIDSSAVTAAVLGADGSLRAVQLGSKGPATAAAVAQSPDGAVLVGDSALRSSGPIATDPIDRARKGRTGALTAVLAHVVGRSAALTGSTPRRLALVVPDDCNREERDRFVESGVAAGITDVILVPVAATQALQPSVDPIARTAAAAAVVAKSGDRPPPIVTREDLGGSSAGAVVRPPARSPDTPIGPRSVFDESVDPLPVVVTPRPSAAAGIDSAAEPTREIPAVASAPRPSEVATTLPPKTAPPRKRRPIGLILALTAIIIAAIGAGVIAIAGGDSSTTAPATTTTPATTAVPTTAAPATTVPAQTSSTSTTSTSTTTSTTSTSTTTTSTTTIPVPVGVPGVVTLVETGLQLDTRAVLNFGQDDTTILGSLTSALGAADLDTGWYETSFCLGTRTRILNWGDLEVVFTEEVLDSGIGTFTQWFVDGIDNPVGLVTVDGLGYGATVGFLDTTYGSAFTIVEAIPEDPTGLFAVTNPASGGVLLGITTSRDPDGLVLSMWAGDSCTRIYT